MDFFLVFFAETCHTIGLALLMFAVLPDLDVVKGAMLTNCMCIVPGIFGECALLAEISTRGREKIMIFNICV